MEVITNPAFVRKSLAEHLCVGDNFLFWDAVLPSEAVEVFPEGRLPNESRFDVAYDAQSKTWKGKLEVPGSPGFELARGAVFSLLTNLDRLYRTWLKA